MYFVYIIRSKVDGRLYKGHTDRLQERIEEHNSGKTKSTKGYVPWVLVYFEKYSSRLDAIEREKYFKTGSGREFIINNIKTGHVVQLDRISDFGSEG